MDLGVDDGGDDDDDDDDDDGDGDDSCGCDCDCEDWSGATTAAPGDR